MNRSEMTLQLSGYRLLYVSDWQTVVGERNCRISRGIPQNTCGFSETLLKPGYYSDLDVKIPMGPGPARRDTLGVEVSYCQVLN
jgi:hypothetical protein